MGVTIWSRYARGTPHRLPKQRHFRAPYKPRRPVEHVHALFRLFFSTSMEEETQLRTHGLVAAVFRLSRVRAAPPNRAEINNLENKNTTGVVCEERKKSVVWLWMVPFRLMHNFWSNRGLGRDSSFVHCSGEHDSLVMMMICGGGGMNSLGFDFWPWQYEI